MLVEIKKYNGKQQKRFTAVFDNGYKVHFGQKNPKLGTFIDHGDLALKDAYIKRHSVKEDWTDPYKPGTLSRYILWDEHYWEIEDAIDDYNKLFFT